jgi:hypothetical protein
VRMEFEKTVDFAGNVTLYINGDKVGGKADQPAGLRRSRGPGDRLGQHQPGLAGIHPAIQLHRHDQEGRAAPEGRGRLRRGGVHAHGPVQAIMGQSVPGTLRPIFSCRRTSRLSCPARRWSSCTRAWEQEVYFEHEETRGIRTPQPAR